MSRNRMVRCAQTACAMAVVLMTTCASFLAAAEVELAVVERQGVSRHNEPVTFGVALPKGEVRNSEQARLMRDGKEIPAQFRATGLWRPQRSIPWLLVDFQTDIEAGAQQKYTLEYGDGASARAKPATETRIQEGDDAYAVSTGAARFRISKRAFDLFRDVQLANGTVVVPRPEPGEPRYGAVVRGLRPMVTRAIPGPTNKGRSHLIYVPCCPQVGLEDYTLPFTSQRQYGVTDGKGQRVGRGAYLEDFGSTHGLVCIPGDAWLQYARPAKGDLYTFRTIPEGHSAASENAREATVLERGPLRSVIRLQGFLGPAGAAVKRVWGRNALSQRCQVHKKRYVQEHLPEKHWDELSRQLHAAYTETDYDTALKRCRPRPAGWSGSIPMPRRVCGKGSRRRSRWFVWGFPSCLAERWRRPIRSSRPSAWPRT